MVFAVDEYKHLLHFGAKSTHYYLTTFTYFRTLLFTYKTTITNCYSQLTWRQFCMPRDPHSSRHSTQLFPTTEIDFDSYKLQLPPTEKRTHVNNKISNTFCDLRSTSAMQY